MERLQNRGLVELHDANPRKYQSVSISTALELLRSEYDSHFETGEQSLHQLEPTYKKAEQGIWAINTHEQVTGRVADLITGANEEVVLIMLDDDLLDDRVLDCLSDASERGVIVSIGTRGGTIQERVKDAEIGAHVFTTELIEWFTAMSGSPRIGRLLLVDRGPVLASALHEEELPGVPNETAAWTDGINHGFATFAERVITYELKKNVPEVYDELEPEQ